MRAELRVPGSRWAQVGTDVLAGAGLVSVAAAFWWGATIVALFALVLLGLTVPRVVQLPGALQVASGTVLLVAAWGATLDWYASVPHLDVVVHAVANGLLAVTALHAMRRTGTLPTAIPRVGAVIVTASLGALLGILWEVGEWWGHTWLDDSIRVGYDDSVGDLVAGTLGSVAAGSAVAGGARRDA